MSILTALATDGHVLAITNNLLSKPMGRLIYDLLDRGLIEEYTTGQPEDEYTYFQATNEARLMFEPKPKTTVN